MGDGLIDVHHHILPPDYVRIVGDARIGPLIVSGKTPEWTPEHSLAAMDRNGIETAVTSMSAPGLWFGDGGAAARLARHCNEYAAEMRVRHPGRFAMFACLPLPEVEASLAEIDHAFDTLGAEGIGLLTSYDGRYPGDPAFEPVFEALDRRGAVVFFHPTAAACCDCLGHIPAATLDFPFDTTRAITSMLFAGTFARHRRIRFVFSHAGGTVPFLAERVVRLERRPELAAGVPDGVMAELRRLYYDTALSANAYAFDALRRLVGTDRILFGSDYPFAPEETMTASIAGLNGLGLDEAGLRAIGCDNARALLLSKPGAGAAEIRQM